MSKRYPTRPQDRFTNFPNSLLDSAAVRSLSPAAFKVLVYLAKRCYGAKGNGKIVFGVRSGCLTLNILAKKYEEQSIDLGRSTVSDALDELQRHGLIRCTCASSFDQKRHAREWRLTWVRTETESATSEYRAFQFDEGAPAKNKTQSAPPDYNGTHSPPERTVDAP